MTRRLDRDRVVVHVAAGPIGDVTLEVADRDRCTLATAHALGFALMLLRAHPSGHSGKRIVAEQRARCRGQIASFDTGNE